MCCRIELNTSQEAAHFLGKAEPNLLPKTNDNCYRNDRFHYSNNSNAPSNHTKPALSLFDKWRQRLI